MKKVLSAFALLALAAPLIAGCAQPATSAPPTTSATPEPLLPFTGKVSLTIYGKAGVEFQKRYNAISGKEDSCTGSFGYSDLGDDGTAKIYGPDNTEVAFDGRLKSSEILTEGCKLTWSFENVLPGKPKYYIRLGHRELFSVDELELRGGVDRTIGADK